jgi:hypothetical protein
VQGESREETRSREVRQGGGRKPAAHAQPAGIGARKPAAQSGAHASDDGEGIMAGRRWRRTAAANLCQHRRTDGARPSGNAKVCAQHRRLTTVSSDRS